MLDEITKRRINSLRNILVGVLPDPKAQIEQITNALIYKFMNDLDEESVLNGGKVTFFSGEYEKYSWKNLMDSKTTGLERVKLYRDALESFYLNPKLSPLFREIFKNSTIPFNNPQMLNMFMGTINEFHYSHSEKLGDAFEYLLSFMGSQGDAGQFRTPRHIIDFIVEILNPQKNETVLDPACGTAGFLISSYKHILNQNTKKNLGDGLTASERIKIGENLNGYDISPDMVKMSLVNMYLHKFTNPKINEYDTLSSEDRWNEYYDVILANPPFFSPRGGITPHNRFGVKSTKAEVLFVDYINEHLKPKGRAGIIVPEGIISNNYLAYKQLRKNLIEHTLIGVISLPAGVFQPYSGVKTSILILDKELNQKSQSIFFAKVDNDGFSLGAQRTPIANNDLPKVVSKFNEFLLGNFLLEECIEKKSILETTDNSLSAGKYLSDNAILNSDYPIKALKDICEITMGQSPKSEFYNEIGDGIEFHQGKTNFGNIFLKPSGVWASQYNKVAEESSILMSVRAPVGSVNITDRRIALGRGLCGIKSNSDCNQMFLFYLLQSSKDRLTQSSHGSIFDSINKDQLRDFEMPLPPIEVQQQIVYELEGYQRIIDGCNQIIENYKPAIDIDPKWEIVELEKIANKITDGTHKTPKYVESGVPFLRVTDITKSDSSKKFISQKEHEELIKRCKPEQGDILYSKNGTIGVSKLVDWDYEFSIFVSLCLIKPDKEKVLPEYLSEILNSIFIFNQSKNLTKTGTVSNLHLVEIKKLKIPLPNLDTQKLIFDEIKNQKNIVNSNIELKQFFENKINNLINSLWSS